LNRLFIDILIARGDHTFCVHLLIYWVLLTQLAWVSLYFFVRARQDYNDSNIKIPAGLNATESAVLELAVGL
jgi:hypothetical protein